VLYDELHGGAATNITVTPGFDPSPLEQPYGVLTAASWSYFIGFDPDGDGLLLSATGSGTR